MKAASHLAAQHVSEFGPNNATIATMEPSPLTQVERPETFQPTFAAALRHSPRRPPILLDTAICVLFVLLCALIYRRLV